MKPCNGRYAGGRQARRVAFGLAVPLALALAPLDAAPASAEGNIIIKDFVLTHAIDEREPIDMVEGFTPADETGYVFARVENDGPRSHLTAVWIHEGEEHARVGLNIGTSSGWRTWSSANLKPGDWTVQLRDEQGVILAEREFAVRSEFAMDDEAGTMSPAAGGFDDQSANYPDEWPDLDTPEPGMGRDIDG
jgi:hypothetical protein